VSQTDFATLQATELAKFNEVNKRYSDWVDSLRLGTRTGPMPLPEIREILKQNAGWANAFLQFADPARTLANAGLPQLSNDVATMIEDIKGGSEAFLKMLDDWSAYYQKIDKTNADLANYTANAMREGMAIMQTGIDNVRLAKALANPGVVLINLKKLFPDE
jgi:hypothetical protein